jgi:hypothetical protein
MDTQYPPEGGPSPIWRTTSQELSSWGFHKSAEGSK